MKSLEDNSIQMWRTLSIENVFTHLDSNPRGLSCAEAALRVAQYGPNELQATEPTSPWAILAAQFKIERSHEHDLRLTGVDPVFQGLQLPIRPPFCAESSFFQVMDFNDDYSIHESGLFFKISPYHKYISICIISFPNHKISRVYRMQHSLPQLKPLSCFLCCRLPHQII